ncbi:MAG: ATP-grasp domain-containing protein [Candidatus Promineifilaceae bacterium]
MMQDRPTTVLCLASYFKGTTVLEACHEEGCHVILLTREKIADKAWPMSAVDERFLMPDVSAMPDVLHAVSYLARARHIDCIIPLDDYDVLTAAALREHTRIPGMGQTTARRFRDKLAMRFRAQEKGLLVPEFVPVLNYDDLREFMGRIPPPWVLKPRTEAGAMGIKVIHDQEALWRWLDKLGDEQSYFLLEQYISGDVYHVDSIVWDEKVTFAEPNKYWQPPINVAHEGGVFVTRTMQRTSKETKSLLSMNKKLVKALGMVRGVTHTEFIRGREDGRFYFLETAARVGGANIAEFVEAATGVNLWREWARLEIAAARNETYKLPEVRQNYAGILVCLAKQEYPDMSGYNDPEVVWRLEGKAYHAGLIVTADSTERIEELLGQYSGRFASDYLAVAPPLDKPPQ